MKGDHEIETAFYQIQKRKCGNFTNPTKDLHLLSMFILSDSARYAEEKSRNFAKVGVWYAQTVQS